jgi:hypothetical protein
LRIPVELDFSQRPPTSSSRSFDAAERSSSRFSASRSALSEAASTPSVAALDSASVALQGETRVKRSRSASSAKREEERTIASGAKREEDSLWAGHCPAQFPLILHSSPFEDPSVRLPSPPPLLLQPPLHLLPLRRALPQLALQVGDASLSGPKSSPHVRECERKCV